MRNLKLGNGAPLERMTRLVLAPDTDSASGAREKRFSDARVRRG